MLMEHNVTFNLYLFLLENQASQFLTAKWNYQELPTNYQETNYQDIYGRSRKINVFLSLRADFRHKYGLNSYLTACL